MKTITVDNYREFKPSEFVRSFISDIDVAIKIGKPMDMGSYSGNGCLPCLGGMACMNMGLKKNINVLWDTVAHLGDGIMRGYSYYVENKINELFKITLPYNIFELQTEDFGGRTLKRESDFTKLKKLVSYYADTLEKAGF